MATPKKKYLVAQTPLPEAKIDATHRIQKEGKKRWEAFNLCRTNHKARLLKTGEWGQQAANEEAWALAIREYPPIPLNEYEELQEKPMRRVAWLPPAEPNVLKELSQLPELNRRNVEEAMIWVLNHPALTRQMEGPANHPERGIYLRSDDIEGCPNRGAWNMLHLAIKDSGKFLKESMDRLIKMAGKGGGNDDTGLPEVDDGLDDLSSMLKRVKGDAA